MKFISGRGISLNHLRKQKMVVLGYGSQGRAQALNLKESGCDVVVGLRKGSPRFQIAKKDGVTPLPLDAALHHAKLICFLFPDEHHVAVYEEYIRPRLKTGMSLIFAHGFNITFGYIEPPSDVNVILVSPKGPGPTLRKAYVDGDGLPSLIAVHQDADGFPLFESAKHLSRGLRLVDAPVPAQRAILLNQVFQQRVIQPPSQDEPSSPFKVAYCGSFSLRAAVRLRHEGVS